MTSHDPQYYVQGVLMQNRRMLAKAITLIESTLPAHRDLSRAIIDRILPEKRWEVLPRKPVKPCFFAKLPDLTSLLLKQ